MLSGSPSIVSFNNIDSAWAGTIIYPPGGRYGPRIQDDLQLVLLHSGEMEIEIDGTAHRITPGSVALLKPDHHEQFIFSSRGETWHRWISIHMSVLPGRERDYFEEMPLFQPISEELNRLTDMMLSLQHEHPSDSDVLRSLGMTVILLYISEISRAREREEVHPSILMAKNLIHKSRLDAGLNPPFILREWLSGKRARPQQK
jgi:AraC family transcriptional regulator of arabinose operon